MDSAVHARMPLLSLRYTDPPTGIRGYLVIDTLVGGLAAGGLRVRPGLDESEIADLAANMTRKQAAVGLRVGGAKAGLDTAPDDGRRHDVIRRFFGTLRPLIHDCFSCGPDMGTSMAELETLAREAGLPCLKIAVARKRGLSDHEFLRRYALFEAPIRGMTLNQLRASAGVAAAAEAALAALEVPPGHGRVAIQGAGNLGGGTAELLAKRARIVAWADDEKCLRDDSGLDIHSLVKTRDRGRLPAHESAREPLDVLTAPCDVLILAAVSDAVPSAMVPNLACRAVVVGANLGLSIEAEASLSSAGVLVVPDLLAGVGGSLAVEALYAGAPQSAEDVLRHVNDRVRAVVDDILAASTRRRTTARALIDARLDAAPKHYEEL